MSTKRCWCGSKNPAYLDVWLSRTCGGDGVLTCICGGEFCVCHNHGEVECFGCEDCNERAAGDDDYWPVYGDDAEMNGEEVAV